MNSRKAIVTGSIKYIESPLSFPQKDMKLIENTLEKRCAIEKNDITSILHSENCEDISFIDKIRQACHRLESERTNVYDLVVFYYSGHGVYIAEEQMSFLQISDTLSVSINEIIEIVSGVNARNKYFIIDACQSGGFSLMKPKGKLQRQYAYNSQGIYCMFGTTKNLLAFEPTMQDIIRKKVNHSFYTHFIAEALNTKSNYNEDTISIRVVDDYASKKTPTYTNFEQIPFSTTEVTGYFPFGYWNETKELNDISAWENQKDSSAQYSSNREIDIVNYLSEQIQKLYSEDTSFFTIPDRELLSRLSQPAKDLLNEKLDLVNKKYNEKPLINGLIASDNNRKRQFLFYILEHPELSIDLTLKDESGNTALYEAIYNSKLYTEYIIQLLFIRGYKMIDSEESFLNNEFKSNATRPEHIENITVAIISHKLMTPELILKSRNIVKLIFTILSFKINKVIGFKINHTALANNLLNHHPDFSTLFLVALKKYDYYDTLKTKPSFVSKEKTILESLPYQETEYNDVLNILFPELFE